MHLSVNSSPALSRPEATGTRDARGAWGVKLDRYGGTFAWVTAAEARDFLVAWADVVVELEDREANPPAECDGGSLPSTHEADVMELRRFAATHATDDDPKGAA